MLWEGGGDFECIAGGGIQGHPDSRKGGVQGGGR
jgi:hypothetical protein